MPLANTIRKFSRRNSFIPDYEIGIVISVAIARKLGCLGIAAQQRYGETENSN